MVELESHRTVQVPEDDSAPPAGDQRALETIDRLSREESALTRQVEEYRQERESWELHRQQEVERLRREGNLLAEAWQRLEAEERRLMAERELLHRGAINEPQSKCSPNSGPSISLVAASSAGETPQTSSDNQDHIAWLQFQQLRREIQKYGRRGT